MQEVGEIMGSGKSMLSVSHNSTFAFFEIILTNGNYLDENIQIAFNLTIDILPENQNDTQKEFFKTT